MANSSSQTVTMLDQPELVPERLDTPSIIGTRVRAARWWLALIFTDWAYQLTRRETGDAPSRDPDLARKCEVLPSSLRCGNPAVEASSIGGLCNDPPPNERDKTNAREQ
jgi:hypothetical protein